MGFGTTVRKFQALSVMGFVFAGGMLGNLAGLGALAQAGDGSVGVEVADAPDDNLALTVAAIQSARSSILLNIYELDAPQITDALLERIKSGVEVRILEEGQPVGGLSTAAKGAQYQLQKAIEAARTKGDALFEMTSKAGGKRRYRYDHAKYAVIDSSILLIGSENYSPTGNPAPGTVGNRGWEVVVHDSAMAQLFTGIFGQDAVTSYSDVLLLAGGKTDYSLASLFIGADEPISPMFVDGLATQADLNSSPDPRPRPTPKPKPGPDSGVTTVVAGGVALAASDVQAITSPDTSLKGLVGAIESARSTLDIEQMTFNSAWISGQSSPLYDAVLAAAKRGVTVRVLLNDESVFNEDSDSSSKPINVPTVDSMNQFAKSHRLKLEARVADIKAMGVDYIHNKGMLIDGTKTLISSINWDENSVDSNREAAVLITSPDVNSNYQRLFDRDWSVSPAFRTSKIIAVSSREVSDAATAPQGARVDLACPATLTARVVFSDLSSSSDPEYSPLSDKSFTAQFIQASASQGRCLMAENSSDSEDRFVELRQLANGSVSFYLEGYTPKTFKIYSVRAPISRAIQDLSALPASVYEGSGLHERLGDAVVSLSLGR